MILNILITIYFLFIPGTFGVLLYLERPFDAFDDFLISFVVSFFGAVLWPFTAMAGIVYWGVKER